MTTKTLLLILATGLSTAPPASAEPLDLGSAWAEAAANNPALARERAELASAQARLKIVRPLLPNPSVRAGLDADTPFESLGERTFNVEIEQELPIFGTRSAAIDEASARIDGTRAAFEASSAAVYAQLRTALADLAAASDYRQLTSLLADAAQDVARAARRRADAGSLSEADSNLAQVDAAAAFAELGDALAAEQAATARLCALLGRTSCGEIEAVWPVGNEAPDSEEALVTKALEQRGDLAEAQAQSAAANAAIRGSERARIPVPTVSVGFVRERAIFNEFGPGYIKSDDFLGVSLQLPIPIWNRGDGAVALAQAEHSVANANIAEARSRIPAEVRAARSRLLSARAATERWASVEPRIDETLDWMRRGFDAGALSLESFLVGRDRLVRARQGLLASRRALVSAAAELDRAIGRAAPLPEGTFR